jgi:hypothetical protein
MIGYFIAYALTFVVAFAIFNDIKNTKMYDIWYGLNIIDCNWKVLVGAIVWPIVLLYVIVTGFIYWIQD